MVQPGEHRATARVVLHNNRDEVFLLLTEFDPEVGLPPRWLTPGGAIEPGETVLEAAVRELYEETGIQITPDLLSTEPIWVTSGRWVWTDGQHHTFEDSFFELAVDDFNLDASGWTTDETRDILEYRFWNVHDLAKSSEFVGPPGLVDFLVSRYGRTCD